MNIYQQFLTEYAVLDNMAMTGQTFFIVKNIVKHFDVLRVAMNLPALDRFRKKLAAGKSVYGLWVTMESPCISAMAAAIGLDWIVIDTEHGHLSWKEILQHVRSTVRSNTVSIVRVTSLDHGQIQRALDIGADGIVIPRIESLEQLRDAVRFAHYPPSGIRGIGVEMATCWGRCMEEHTKIANEKVLVIPLIETIQAGKIIEQLCEVPGSEIFFVGPHDYSASAGYAGKWEGPGIVEEIARVKDTVRRHGKHCGIVATNDQNILERQASGFHMLGIGVDTVLFLNRITQSLDHLGRDTRMSTTLFPPETDE
jgi:2-keto-3-deoxy-L-rhamnonate aldolase RhmA